MKRFLIVLVLMSFLISSDVEEKEIGRYQLAVSTYVSKKGTTFIVETVFDTKTGKVIGRKKIKSYKYKLPYKNRKGKMIYHD
tara:strand:- start:453 stop:698 length:246 start_codon:yes stop_codon:yes gene_type:complete